MGRIRNDEPSSDASANAAGLAKNCGSCLLYGANFYPRRPGWIADNTCCADVVMDLPASFIPNRQTMAAHEGEGCICWEPAKPTPPDQNSTGRLVTKSDEAPSDLQPSEGK